ncbi:MAG: acylphosphatase [Planctomycetota bacterium]
MSSPQIRRTRVFYSGRVQGVGFRWRAHQIVLACGGLTGFVRNLGDGRVELVLEGPRERIEDALSKVQDHFVGFIRSFEQGWEEPSPTLEGFSIER